MSKVKSRYEGFVGHEGVPVLLHEGEEYDADHPLVVAHPEHFTEPPAPEPPAPKRTQARTLTSRGKAKDDNG